MSGQNVQNTASNDEERKISTSNVATLAPKWVATTGGDVSARAAVVGRAVYFPDFGGNLWALDADTGAVIWQVQLSTLFGLPPRHRRVAHEPGGSTRHRLYRHASGPRL